MAQSAPPLTVEQLRTTIADGTIDTVVVAFPDMQGRLQGKRIHAQFFLDTVLENGTEACNKKCCQDSIIYLCRIYLPLNCYKASV